MNYDLGGPLASMSVPGAVGGKKEKKDEVIGGPQEVKRNEQGNHVVPPAYQLCMMCLRQRIPDITAMGLSLRPIQSQNNAEKLFLTETWLSLSFTETMV